MEEKKNLLDSIEKIGQDDKILQATKLEDSIEDRYRIIAGYAKDEGVQEGIQLGIQEGVEKTTLDIIKNMLKNNSEYEFISQITGKSIKEIKKIEASN
jgi:predicted transposase/invertase (TIGR01784 family)